MNDFVTHDGEIVETPRVPQLVDTSGLSAIVRAEIDAQIVTARQFPRVLQRVIGNISTLATLDEETAAGHDTTRLNTRGPSTQR